MRFEDYRDGIGEEKGGSNWFAKCDCLSEQS